MYDGIYSHPAWRQSSPFISQGRTSGIRIERIITAFNPFNIFGRDSSSRRLVSCTSSFHSLFLFIVVKYRKRALIAAVGSLIWCGTPSVGSPDVGREPSKPQTLLIRVSNSPSRPLFEPKVPFRNAEAVRREASGVFCILRRVNVYYLSTKKVGYPPRRLITKPWTSLPNSFTVHRHVTRMS